MPDIADLVDRLEAPWDDEDGQDGMFVPAEFIIVTSRGIAPETGGDIVDGRYADLLGHGDTPEDAASAIDAEFMSFEEWLGVYGGC